MRIARWAVGKIGWHPWPVQVCMRWLATWGQHDGMAIGILNPSQPPGQREKVVAALDLLRDVSPAMYRRLRSSVNTVLVAPAKGVGGAHYAGTRRCLLAQEVVANRSVGLLAGVLVHEATHARISRAGRLAIWGAGGRRAEACCVRAERDFAVLLPRDAYPNLDAWLRYLNERLEKLEPPQPPVDHAA